MNVRKAAIHFKELSLTTFTKELRAYALEVELLGCLFMITLYHRFLHSAFLLKSTPFCFFMIMRNGIYGKKR